MTRLLRLLPVLCLFFPAPALAQLDVGPAVRSLAGTPALAFELNVEAEAPLADDPALDLAGPVRERLSALPLATRAGDTPYLYVHVNALSMDRGLVPFTVTLQFIQPVQLVLGTRATIPAATWESSTLGLVSSDNLPWITDAVLALVDEFISDFRQTNP